MTPQKINSAYLQDCAEFLDQLADCLNEKADDYIDSEPVEYYKWARVNFMANELRAACTCRAEELAEQERKDAPNE